MQKKLAGKKKVNRNMNRLLYTIKEIFSKEGYLSEHQQKKEYFNVPLYQRGYKWKSKEIKRLLDDIDHFEPSGSKFYCLQNITIVPNNIYFNVVDGQQRLTTLSILLSFLGETKLVEKKVRFPENEIRRETNRFLEEIIINPEIDFPQETWQQFIEKNSNYDHQDIFHLFFAHKATEEWFGEKEKNIPAFKREDFCNKLLTHVKLIVNRIEGEANEEKIFGNLNSKRVPLDGADLVRAIIITRVANEEGKRESDIKNIVRVNERRVKIGWEFDQINNWWSREDVKNYFGQFVSITSEEIAAGNKLFKVDKYPINLLLLLFAEKMGEKTLTLELIERHNNNALGLYKELIKLDSTLKDWFEDREIYHYLGFLFFNAPKKEVSFSQIWGKWELSNTRIAFKKELQSEIRKLIIGDDAPFDFTDKNVNWYENETQKLVQVLLLMDIIHSLKENRAFLPYYAFTKSNIDIEHIFPQNPERVEDKKEYIEFLNSYILKEKNVFNIAEYDQRNDDEEYMQKVESFIKEHIQSIKINSIGNLVLLQDSLNRGIGRISYAKKRARIVEYFSEGNFIQPHTFQVFVRYFNDEKHENKDHDHWTNLDIEANANFIGETIHAFFKGQSNE
jgi:uncharacterized protein with ParB-like and HNH nuclease domain